MKRWGDMRRDFHWRILHHTVARTVVRNTGMNGVFREFFYTSGWVCLDCGKTWKR